MCKCLADNSRKELAQATRARARARNSRKLTRASLDFLTFFITYSIYIYIYIYIFGARVYFVATKEKRVFSRRD